MRRASRKPPPSRLTPGDRRKTRSLAPRLVNWFRANARDLPWRRTTDPYAIWVSEIMLQQTQVGTVVPYYERWMHRLPTVQALARCSSQRLHKLWEGLGYYTRVRNMRKAARLICREHDGVFPESLDQILALPGIGRYTAGAIGSIAFNQPTPIVDGNVVRVLTRLFGISDDPRKKETNARLWQLAEALVEHVARFPVSDLRSPTSDLPSPRLPPLPCSALNQSLMELGARICTPRNARCGECPVSRGCVAHRENQVDQLPAAQPRQRTVKKLVRAFVIRDGNQVLAVHRRKATVNTNLWEFPNIEINTDTLTPRQSARAASGMHVKRLEPLMTFKHSITHHRITVEVFTCDLKSMDSEPPAHTRWLDKNALERMPFSAAHRRIARQITRTAAAQ